MQPTQEEFKEDVLLREVTTGLKSRGVVVLSQLGFLNAFKPGRYTGTEARFERPEHAELMKFRPSAYDSAKVLRELSWLQPGDFISFAVTKDVFEPSLLIVGVAKGGTAARAP
jgi:hypothetical protein